MTAKSDILIAGGYGVVGRRVTANLAHDYPNQVVIAGRDVEMASRVASELGYGVRARHIDVQDRDSVEKAMHGVGTVMSCVAQPETPYLLLAAISQGCGYTDTAPMSLKRPAYPDALRAEAVDNGARIVLGAGLVPGISNVLARMGADRVGPVDSIESACLLSLGDEYGSDSKGFVAEEIVTAFKATISGENVLARPFTGPRRIEFAPPLGVVLGPNGVYEASVQGHGQANATALSAAAFVRALVEGEVDHPGIWTADQVVPGGPFLERLAAHGVVPTVHVSERDNRLSGRYAA